jgi:outer membrane protein OmpA-like peptidoglycan-associated protein
VESGGVIPLPAVELGLTIKPFLFGKKAPARTPAAAVESVPVVEIPAEPAAEIPASEPVPVAEPVRVVQVLLFPADTAVPAGSRPAGLDAAAELLRSSPELGVTLRGYAAPYGNRTWLLSLSERRVRFCADYLEREHGIARERITVEWYGAEKSPEAADGSDRTLRCVEIIVEPLAQGGGES